MANLGAFLAQNVASRMPGVAQSLAVQWSRLLVTFVDRCRSGRTVNVEFISQLGSNQMNEASGAMVQWWPFNTTMNQDLD